MSTLKIITPALIGASILLATACRPGNVNGILIGHFADEKPMFSSDIAQLIGVPNEAIPIVALCMAGFLATVTQSPITSAIIVMEMIDWS